MDFVNAKFFFHGVVFQTDGEIYKNRFGLRWGKCHNRHHARHTESSFSQLTGFFMTTASSTGSAARPHFYIRQADRQREAGLDLALWPRNPEKPGKHDYSGQLNGKPCVAYLANGSRGKFISVKSLEERDERNYAKQLATGNVIAGKSGYPVLALNLSVPAGEPRQTLWADCSRDAPQELLVELGLDLKRMEENRANRPAEGAESASTQEASPASKAPAAQRPAAAPAPETMRQAFEDLDSDIPF